MSVRNFLGAVFSGNLSNAWARLENWWTSLSPGIQNFIGTLETNEGKILQGLVVTAAQDVLKNGISTASFVAAAADIESKLIAQNIALGQQTIFAALNAEVAAQTPVTNPVGSPVDPAPVAAPVEPVPVPADPAPAPAPAPAENVVAHTAVPIGE